MKKFIFATAAAFLVAGMVAEAANQNISFSRYQVILDRKPFGDPPPPPPPPAPPPKKQINPEDTQLGKNYRMSSIKIIEGEGISVGLVDLQSQASIILGLGEKHGATGIELLEADYDREEAKLRMGEEEVVMKLEGGPTAPAPKAAATRSSSSESRSSVANRFTPVVTRRTLNSSRSSSIRRPPTPKFTGSELKKHLQEYNMEVIRKGLPPLPIPLTKEQDEQLVREGILPKE